MTASLPSRRPALLLLAVTASLVLWTGCGSDDGPDPSDAPRTNAASIQKTEVTRLETPEPVDSLAVRTLDGDALRLDAPGEGRAYVVNFWATWCAPCRVEVPDLIALQDTLQSEGITVVGVSMDRGDTTKVRRFVEEQEIDYPTVYADAKAVEAALGPVYGLPMTIVIGPDGTVTHRVLGVFPVDQMKSELRMLVGESSGT